RPTRSIIGAGSPIRGWQAAETSNGRRFSSNSDGICGLAAGVRHPFYFDCRKWRFLMQVVTDFGEPCVSARFVLVASGCATDADGADRVIAILDRHTALPGRELGIVDGWIEGARRRDPLGEIRRGDPEYGSRISLAPRDLASERACAV